MLKIDGSICAYRIFYLQIFRRIEGGEWNLTPPPGPYGTEKNVVLRGLKLHLVWVETLRPARRIFVSRGKNESKRWEGEGGGWMIQIDNIYPWRALILACIPSLFPSVSSDSFIHGK